MGMRPRRCVQEEACHQRKMTPNLAELGNEPSAPGRRWLRRDGVGTPNLLGVPVPVQQNLVGQSHPGTLKSWSSLST
jgi:hypothetical protein